MAKHNVKKTRGTFKLVGDVKMSKDPKRFFKNYSFESGTKKNVLNFGVKTSNANESYVQLEGFTQKVAKFGKWDNKAKKRTEKEVSWASRLDFEEEGFSPNFGTRMNLTDDKENIVSLFQFDACEELKDGLRDGMSVYVEGDTKFTSYKKEGEVRRHKALALNKIYKQDKPIDFDAEDFKEENRFQQEFIYMGIEQEIVDDKPTGRGLVSAKIVTDETVEDTEFVVENKALIQTMKTKLKPYYAIKAVGRLVTKVEEGETPKEVVKQEAGWGDDEDFEEVGNSVKFKEWVITKLLKESLDTDTYSEEVLASITVAEEEYGDVNWDDSTDDDDDVWED